VITHHYVGLRVLIAMGRGVMITMGRGVVNHYAYEMQKGAG